MAESGCAVCAGGNPKFGLDPVEPPEAKAASLPAAGIAGAAAASAAGITACAAAFFVARRKRNVNPLPPPPLPRQPSLPPSPKGSHVLRATRKGLVHLRRRLTNEGVASFQVHPHPDQVKAKPSSPSGLPTAPKPLQFVLPPITTVIIPPPLPPPPGLPPASCHVQCDHINATMNPKIAAGLEGLWASARAFPATQFLARRALHGSHHALSIMDHAWDFHCPPPSPPDAALAVLSICHCSEHSFGHKVAV